MTSNQKCSILDTTESEPKDDKNVEENGTTVTEQRSRKMVKQSDVDGRDEVVEPFDKMKLIKENLFLLSEIDKLKQTNSSLTQKIYYLESFTRVSTRKS